MVVRFGFFLIFWLLDSSSSLKMPVIEATAKHTATIIFLHGLGDTGHGWISSIAAIRQPYMKVVCPTASTIPVTLNNGFQMPAWFDLKGLDPSSPEDESGIKSATSIVHGLIREEKEKGISTDRIILGGFSQGGALALYSALTCNDKLGGVVALSCWLPLHKTFPQSLASVNKDIAVLQCHGNSDPIVPLFLGQLTASALRNVTKNFDFKTYNGLSHSSSEQEMEDIRNFFTTHLPSI